MGCCDVGRKQSAIDTRSLLALAASMPPQGMLYDGVWGKVITPSRWRKACHLTQTESLLDMFVMEFGMGLELGLVMVPAYAREQWVI